MPSFRIPRAVASALLLAGVLVGGLAGATPVAAVATTTPMILQEVPVWDLEGNTNGICTSGATMVIKNAAGTFNAANYLEKAQACGFKVIFAFPETINYGTGAIYPSRVARWVNKVKNHPATFGYISVKEGSRQGISKTETRTMYKAFRAADSHHPVIVLFGDMPHFGTTRNPYSTGMCNIVMFDWYPVETTDGKNSIYLTGASKWFPRAKRIVQNLTPGKRMWLMVQTHKYLKPATHKKQRPTTAQLYRQVREGFSYLGASGIAFHVWRNTNYTRDQLRDPAMVDAMAKLFADVKAGTFR